MRLKQTRVKTYYMRPRIIETDNEGVVNTYYVDDRVFTMPDGKYLVMPDGKRLAIHYENMFTVKGILWDTVGDRQIHEYGEKISNTASLRIEGQYKIILKNKIPTVLFADGREIQPNDGLYVFADIKGEPDYIVTRITAYNPLKLEVEYVG